MPDMDGIEFLKHLKSEGNTTPFIIFTGKGREEVVIEALNAGADGYLQKGGESKSQFAELSHKIKKAVEGRQAEEASKDSEERFRSLFDSALDMIQIIRPDGSFLHVNPAWKKTLGYSDDDVRTLSVFDIFHPDSLAHCSSKFGELLSGAGALNIEAQFLTKDKKTISVEGNCNPELKDGTVVSIRGIFHDITERKQAEDALRESEARYREFFSISRDSVFITSPEGRWIDFNDATLEIFGYESRKVLFEVPISRRTGGVHPSHRTKRLCQRISRAVKAKRWDGY
jgi:PAS domain S-box-containing protein